MLYILSGLAFLFIAQTNDLIYPRNIQYSVHCVRCSAKRNYAPLGDELFISTYQKAHPRAVHKCHLRHIKYDPFAADIFQRLVHLIPQRLGAAMIKLSVQIYDKIVSAFNCSVQNSFTILKPLLRLCLHIYPPVIIISAQAANSLCNLLTKQHCFCKFSLEIVFEM